MTEEQNPIRDIDRHFGSLIRELSQDSVLERTAFLSSYVLSNGDICLNLEQAKDLPESDLLPPLEEWKKTLESYPEIVGKPGDYCPLIFDGKRVYLHRYWNYENTIRDRIERLIHLESLEISSEIKTRIREWFETSEDLSEFGGHLQLVAALLPFVSGFSVISGGPGTGKTTVLAKILALQILHNPRIEIALAAPTGKAAARMLESLSASLLSLNLEDSLREKLASLKSYTIHRLLGSRFSSPYFHHDEENPLSADLVVVDETSMVDVALMAKLLRALKPDARLILLGDMFQLSSVEAGSVFGDICESFRINDFSSDFQERVKELTDQRNQLPDLPKERSLFRDRLVLLKKSYRFQGKGGIGQSSRLINEGRTEEALELMREDPQSSFEEAVSLEEFLNRLIEHYQALNNASSSEQALNLLESFKVLTTLNRGPWGKEGINRRLEKHFSKGKEKTFYQNKPILILQNDADQKLFNGDQGVIRLDEEGRWMAWFYDNNRKLVRHLPLLLPKYQTAYAMTIHKSQGSEFDTVYTVLPQEEHPLVTRELIYTAVTRAKKRSILFCPESVLSSGIRKRNLRSSGLKESLIQSLSSERNNSE